MEKEIKYEEKLFLFSPCTVVAAVAVVLLGVFLFLFWSYFLVCLFVCFLHILE